MLLRGMLIFLRMWNRFCGGLRWLLLLLLRHFILLRFPRIECLVVSDRMGIVVFFAQVVFGC